MKFLLNEPLAPYTYIKVGGPAEKLVIVSSQAEIIEAILQSRRENIPYLILGAASNVLISDQGLPGLVIINRTHSIQESKTQPNHLMVDSGTTINHLVNFANQRGLGGLAEFLGLPGTVGGAIYNNSHHLTHLIGETVASVTILDSAGKIRTLNRDECDFGYDHSRFQATKETILSVDFALSKDSPAHLSQLAKAALMHRKTSQPLEFPSSGCMFQNPPKPSASAGYLIDQAGCKGLTVGQAQVSAKHANFEINLGGATAADFVSLSNLVRQRVYKKHGVYLDREIFFLGSHPGLETGKSSV